jgi:hypothetical protein
MLTFDGTLAFAGADDAVAFGAAFGAVVLDGAGVALAALAAADAAADTG